MEKETRLLPFDPFDENDMQSGNCGFSTSRQRLAIRTHHKTNINIGFNFISTDVKL